MNNRYSLDRREKKLAGVCSTIGDIFNVDPTIVRIGFVAVALLVKWEVALIAYIAAGIYFHMKRKQADGGTYTSHVRGDRGVLNVSLRATVPIFTPTQESTGEK